MSTYNLNVTNKSNVNITVTGSRSGSFPIVALNQTIAPTHSLLVAVFDAGGPLSDNWGWVYLDCGGVACQIYAESASGGNQYAFFGYYNPHSSESNSNPSPFPAGVATASDGDSFDYTLLQAPPQFVAEASDAGLLEPAQAAAG